MFHNRIARYTNRLSNSFPAGGNSFPAADADAADSRQLVSQIAPGMVMVPMPAQGATWQSQLYRVAYARAVADVAPPRHMRRFFSIWN